MAATEFALLLPVMIMLFFGLVEASNAMTVNRKVAISANTLADLTAQTEQILVSEMDDLFEGVIAIVEPNDTTGMRLTLVSVILNEDGDPIVHWSRDSDGTEPYSAGGAYAKLDDDQVISEHGSLIVVEMVYTYTPSITKHVIDSPIMFDRQAIRWPRVTNRVQLCQSEGDCTT